MLKFKLPDVPVGVKIKTMKPGDWFLYRDDLCYKKYDGDIEIIGYSEKSTETDKADAYTASGIADAFCIPVKVEIKVTTK